MKMRLLAVTSAAALMAAGAAAEAGTCSISDVTTSTACVSTVPGGPGGNVKTQQMNDNIVFGHNDWFEIGFDADIIGIVGGALSGTWALTGPLTWGSGVYAIALKGGTDNAVYLIDPSVTSGTWNTDGLLNNGGNHPKLSHAKLFGTAALTDVPPPSAVPLPAAGFLLVGALGGLAVIRRRKRA